MKDVPIVHINKLMVAERIAAAKSLPAPRRRSPRLFDKTLPGRFPKRLDLAARFATTVVTARQSKSERCVMFRITLAAAAVYACGCPGLDGHRPASFDKSLQGFYNEVNVTAIESARVFSLLDKERTQHYFDLFKQRFADGLQESQRTPK
jgi:hypothetical protein